MKRWFKVIAAALLLFVFSALWGAACWNFVEAQQNLKFDWRVVENLSLLYLAFYPNEFVACLESDDGENITDFRLLPIQYREYHVQSSDRNLQKIKGVAFADTLDRRQLCVRYPQTLMVLHSHPNKDENEDKYCFLSPQDISITNRNKIPYVGIICEEGIFWWAKSQLEEGEAVYPIERMAFSCSISDCPADPDSLLLFKFEWSQFVPFSAYWKPYLKEVK